MDYPVKAPTAVEHFAQCMHNLQPRALYCEGLFQHRKIRGGRYCAGSGQIVEKRTVPITFDSAGMNHNRCPLPFYGQIVIGPPGSGKTTYCRAMKIFLAESEEYDLDVRTFVDLNAVVSDRCLGPNGGMVYCLELLEIQVEELTKRIQAILNEKPNCKYILFDFPGQAELYTHLECVHNILDRLQTLLECHLICVHIVDSQHCVDPGRFLSVLLTTLFGMLRLALPHVNVLSKFDLMERNEVFLSFGIDFYTEVLDLHYLLEHMPQSSFSSKYNKLSKMLCQVVEDFGLVSFHPLAAHDEVSLSNLISVIDNVSGYASDER
uniref:GPN-loop GTPase 2 n=1 Tax=Trichuris muris TaxID=70415 RepID=A0A5S6QD86_TRIMR